MAEQGAVRPPEATAAVPSLNARLLQEGPFGVAGSVVLVMFLQSRGFVLLGSLVAIGASCSQSAAPPATVTRQATIAVTRQPPSTAEAPVLVIPTPQGTFNRCEVAQLEAQLIRVGAAAGNIEGIVEIRNHSGAECDLYGYAGIQLLDSDGRPLPTKVRWTTRSFFPPDTPVSAVALPSDTDPITPSRPVPGHAYIAISWNDVQPPCEMAGQLKVTPPDSYESITIAVTLPGAGPRQLTVCSGGSLVVKPVQPAMSS